MDNSKLDYIYKKVNTINSDIILDFINKYNLNYSENKNGYFLNLSKLDNHIIDKLYEIIDSNKSSYSNININFINNDFKGYELFNINNYNSTNKYTQNNNDTNNKDIQYKQLILDDVIDLYIIELSKKLYT